MSLSSSQLRLRPETEDHFFPNAFVPPQVEALYRRSRTVLNIVLFLFLFTFMFGGLKN